MSFDRILAFIVVGLTCLLIGGVGGLLIGARSEQNGFMSMLAHGTFTDDCKQQIRNAMQGEQDGAPAQ
jgi:hypothetical protein